MRTQMKGAVVVVTGASSGIGRATALEMARREANVALLARRREALEELARECERHGVRAIALTADVTDEPTVKAAARHVVDTHGHIDVNTGRRPRDAAAVPARARRADDRPSGRAPIAARSLRRRRKRLARAAIAAAAIALPVAFGAAVLRWI